MKFPRRNTCCISEARGVRAAFRHSLPAPAKMFRFVRWSHARSLDMNLDHLSNGMYFVEVNYDSTSEIIKFIKE